MTTTWEKIVSTWHFEETSGLRYDAKGFNHLSIINDYGNVSGYVDQGCNMVTYIDALGGHKHTRLEIEDASIIGLEPDFFSFFIWVRMDVPWTNNVIACKKDYTYTSWALSVSGDKLRFETSANGLTIDAMEVDAPSIEEWHLIGCSYDSSTKTKTLVVDGALEISGPAGHGSILYNSAMPFTIGGLADDGFGIRGVVDEAGFANYTFTEEDWAFILEEGQLVAPEETFEMPLEDSMCNTRSIEELDAQIKRFMPPVMKTSAAEKAEEFYKAYCRVFQLNEEENCELFKESFIEYAEGDFVDLLAADYGVARFQQEEDATLKSRMRQVEDKITKPSIEEAVNNLVETDEAIIRDCIMDGLFCDGLTYYDRVYFYYEGDNAERKFILVVPPQYDSSGKDYFNHYSYYNNNSYWGSSGEEVELYNQIWDLVDKLRAAGVQVVLEIADIP